MRSGRLPALLAVLAAACSRGSDAPAPSSSAATPLAASAKPDRPTASSVALDFVSGFDACTLGHRGVLLDVGDKTLRARMSGGKLAPPEVEVREHEGATWGQIHDRSFELSFVSPAETEGNVVVEARVRGGAARSASVYLNGRPLGTLSFTKGEAKIVSLHAPAGTIARGANDLLLKFIGGTKTPHDQLAEIDWIRVGPADGDAPYAAPTRSDALTTTTLANVARRGVSLRAPGFVRCDGFVPKGAVLEGWIGVTGGEADAEVRVVVDRAEPRVAASFHVGGGEGPQTWRPMSVPLGDVGTLAGIELVAKGSSKGARVAFGEPRVVSQPVPAAAKAPASKGVVLVVLGTTSPRSLGAYGGTTPTPELSALADRGMLFEGHRASTSLGHGAVASMLTGLSPREHGVTDGDAALGPGLLTIAEAARQAGVVTAMFTANPMTSAAFGFARGFETFASRSPTEDGAVAIFDDVGKWIESHKDDRFLVVVHARGGHPPWDVSAEELKDLAPAGYSGSLEGRHAAEMLSKAKRGAARLVGDPDRERAFALYARAIAAHDAALGRLVARVRTLGRDADTTWIVTGDVGFDPAAHVPFLEDEALDEASLAVPLVVRGPAGTAPPRARVPSATTSLDVARTALEALDLTPPPIMRGASLWAAAQTSRPAEERPLVATTSSRFSARWGGFVLLGARDRELKLCNLSLEPECASDVRATHPLAAEIMHTVAFDEIEGARGKPTAPRANLDTAASAALRAWGR
jgi:arylsulfatase A-like enzyme